MSDINGKIAALEAELQAARDKEEAFRFLHNEDKPHATEEEIDLGMLRLAGVRAERRLAECRARGKAGWFTRSESDLRAALAKNVSENNYLDALILSAMLLARASIKGE